MPVSPHLKMSPELCSAHWLVVRSQKFPRSVPNCRYNDVPYHNSTHAADVLSRVSAIIQADGILMDGSPDSNSLLLATLLAAIVHDYRHPGLSNAFQVTADSELSQEFNEQHVLEMHSLKQSLGVLRSGSFNVFVNPSKRRIRDLCSDVITLVSHHVPVCSVITIPTSSVIIIPKHNRHYTCDKSSGYPQQPVLTQCETAPQVLATDMGRHFELLSSFKGKVIQDWRSLLPPGVPA